MGWHLVYEHQELWCTENEVACATVYFRHALQETVAPCVCADGHIDACRIVLRDKLDCQQGMHLPMCKGVCSCVQGTVPQRLNCGPDLQQCRVVGGIWDLSEGRGH